MENPQVYALHRLIRDISVFNTIADSVVLSKHKVRTVRYYALMHLHDQPGLSLKQLSDRLMSARGSASRMVFSMEKDNLVRRVPDSNDRRMFTLSLTEDGEKLYQRIEADLRADIQERFEPLDSDKVDTLLQMNSELRHVLKAHPALQEK